MAHLSPMARTLWRGAAGPAGVRGVRRLGSVVGHEEAKEVAVAQGVWDLGYIYIIYIYIFNIIYIYIYI